MKKLFLFIERIPLLHAPGYFLGAVGLILIILTVVL
tara:strand:- start:389 stop:496 length:108 start_codon:yes stop_codon:yes gene_type:complete